MIVGSVPSLDTGSATRETERKTPLFDGAVCRLPQARLKLANRSELVCFADKWPIDWFSCLSPSITTVTCVPPSVSNLLQARCKGLPCLPIFFLHLSPTWPRSATPHSPPPFCTLNGILFVTCLAGNFQLPKCLTTSSLIDLFSLRPVD